MKSAPLIIAIVLSALVGCRSTPPPAPGMASLRLAVIAEPKTGVITGDTHVSAYDDPPTPTDNTGAFERVDYTSLGDIVVWLESGEHATSNPPQGASVSVNLGPHEPADSLSAVASVGGAVTFHNAGSAGLNLYSVSDGNDFDLGTVPAGGTATYTVKSAGLIDVLTDSMKEPIALVYAAPTTMVRLTHAGEIVEFRDLPPGNYKIFSWHPRLPGQEILTLLSPNQISDASIKVGVNDLPKAYAR